MGQPRSSTHSHSTPSPVPSLEKWSIGGRWCWLSALIVSRSRRLGSWSSCGGSGSNTRGGQPSSSKAARTATWFGAGTRKRFTTCPSTDSSRRSMSQRGTPCAAVRSFIGLPSVQCAVQPDTARYPGANKKERRNQGCFRDPCDRAPTNSTWPGAPTAGARSKYCLVGPRA